MHILREMLAFWASSKPRLISCWENLSLTQNDSKTFQEQSEIAGWTSNENQNKINTNAVFILKSIQNIMSFVYRNLACSRRSLVKVQHTPEMITKHGPNSSAFLVFSYISVQFPVSWLKLIFFSYSIPAVIGRRSAQPIGTVSFVYLTVAFDEGKNWNENREQ